MNSNNIIQRLRRWTEDQEGQCCDPFNVWFPLKAVAPGVRLSVWSLVDKEVRRSSPRKDELQQRETEFTNHATSCSLSLQWLYDVHSHESCDSSSLFHQIKYWTLIETFLKVYLEKKTCSTSLLDILNSVNVTHKLNFFHKTFQECNEHGNIFLWMNK